MKHLLRAVRCGPIRRGVPAVLLAVLTLARPPVALAQSDGPFTAQAEIPETYPSVGATFGMGWYLSDFSAVERAFHSIENAYAAGGYTVPPARDVDLPPIVLPSIRVRLSPWIEATLQAGRAEGMSDELGLVGGLVSARYPLKRPGKVFLLVGAGAGIYRFSFARSYGVQISPVDGNGGYYELDQITLAGRGSYWTAAGGLSIRAWRRGAVEASVQYVGTGDVSTDLTRAGRVSLNMSGAMIGLSVTGFF